VQPRHLWLLRHAKSSWDDPALADIDRPLAARGIRAAGAMAAYLTDADIRPDLVLCSAGLRARQTMATVLPSLGGALDVNVRPDLYTFDSDVLLQHLRGLGDDLSTVMLVGHNPALHELALTLCGRGEGLDRLRSKLPTGALAGIRLPGSWRALGEVRGELVSFVTPRDLEERASGG
jgi:phosphohistidine phosphatase